MRMSTVAAIEDEHLLAEMLEVETDFEKRSVIRGRLMELKKQKKEMREAQAKKREDDRDMAIRNKAAQADLQKQRTLEMYSAMAKSAPAGGPKVMDVGIYKRGEAGEGIVTSVNQGLVEDAIKETANQRELEKKRMLAAFEAAAKSGPAGAPKDVNFDAFKRADVSGFDASRKEYDSTMQVSGGIPLYDPALIKSPPSGTPAACMNGPDFAAAARNVDPPMDAMQRAIKERQEACDAEKKRILAAYAIAAKQGPGPKQNVLDDFKNVKIDDVETLKTEHSSCAGFKGGVPRSQATDAPKAMRSTCFAPAKPKPPPVLNVRRGSTSTYSISPLSSPPSANTPPSAGTPRSGNQVGTNLNQAAEKLEKMDAVQKAVQRRNEAAEQERQRILAEYIASKTGAFSRETTPVRESPASRTPSSPRPVRSSAFRPIPIRPPRPLK